MRVIGLALGVALAAAAPSWAADKPLQFSPASPADHQAVVAKGERLVSVLGCNGCHNADLKGEDWSDPKQDFTLWTANVTVALQHYDDAQLETMLRKGVRPDGSAVWVMPSQTFARLSAPDMAALIAYLRTVKPDGEAHPPRHWGPDFAAKTSADDRKLAPELVEEFRRDTPMDLGKRHAWGRYLVSTTCSECHGPALKGYVEPYTPNLNAVATYDLAQFRRLMREGVSVDGERDLGLMARVAKSHFSKLTDDEVKAIYDYLAVRAAKG